MQAEEISWLKVHKMTKHTSVSKGIATHSQRNFHTLAKGTQSEERYIFKQRNGHTLAKGMYM